MKFVNFCRGVFVLVVASILTLFVSLATLLCLAVLRWPQEKFMKLTRIWARCVLAASGVSVQVEEGQSLEPDRSYIFAANHQSQFDILAMQGFFKADFRWLAKKELFRIPVFGPAMRMIGFIPVDRSHGRQAMKSLLEAARRIANGASVVIFPEGTRSPDGKLRDFKSGSVFLALKAGVPLVPVAILGTHEILAKGKLLARPGKVLIRVGNPIETKDFKPAQKQELLEVLRQAVADLMADSAT